ncbi:MULTISPECIES: SURF1 family cytochrome oxidase biogenesis protein [Hyphobacterium]|uniref:SURF1-like protein n=1 Tax=Hyphobacterium vulgare TaxID=1736751 RepID=A0ABV6ZYN6_9PROT
MYFRPYPVLSILTLLGLGVLIWLGQWQWSRMGEKAEQIAAWEAVANAAPITLTEAICGTPRPGVPVEPAAGSGSGIRVWGRNEDGHGGWRRFVAVEPPDCAEGGHVLQEVDFTVFGGDEPTNAGPDFRIMPVPAHGLFDAANNPEANEFYRFDAEQMAEVAGVDSLNAEYWVVADRGLPPELAEVPPSRHLGYALTWFGLAAVLMAVFLAFHAAHGRLGFTRR